MRYTDWEELEVPVRLAIEARTGRVHTQGNAVPGQLLIQGLLTEVGGAADGGEGICG